jgi:hypothetical protein
MRKELLAAVGLIALAAAGCPSRGARLRAPSAESVAREAREGTFGRKLEVILGDSPQHAVQAFRFELPAPGGIFASAKAADPTIGVALAIYGSRQSAIAQGEAGKKLEAKDLQPGTYYVAVIEPKDVVRTSVELRVFYNPRDPDAAHSTCKSEATARDLFADSPPIEDQVDYSARRRTCYWRLALQTDGALKLKFDNHGNGISAELISGHGAPEKIEPGEGLSKGDLPAGAYYVKVYADNAGDAGRYSLSAEFEEADTCQNGGPACSIQGSEELKVPNDSRIAEVDYGKRRQFHFYKVPLKEKGKLAVSFKVLQPARGSRVQAFFMRDADDSGERILGNVTKDIEAPGDYYLRVQAKDPGDAARFAVGILWSPANFIPAEVVEIGRSPCVLTVSAGTNQGVHPGVACTVVSASGQPIDSCVVDQAFPNLSKVRPGNARCNLQMTARVQISAP